MVGLVHHRPWQVVHRRIDDAEILLFARLQIEHLRQAHAGIAHERAAGFDHELPASLAACVQPGQQLGPERVGGGWRISVVVDAEPTAEIDVLQADALGLHGVHQVENAIHGIEVGGFLGDLRADVAIDSLDMQAWQLRRTLVGGEHALVRYAEFVALQACGDVGMGLGIHVRIHADAHGCPDAHALSHAAQYFELGFAFHVEAAYADTQGLAHFRARLANAGKDHRGRVAARGQHASELAARDDVEPAPGLREQLQHRQR